MARTGTRGRRIVRPYVRATSGNPEPYAITTHEINRESKLEINVIKEIHPKVFHAILDFPNPKIVTKLLSDDYKYILVRDYKTGNSTWKNYDLPLNEKSENIGVISKTISFDFIVTLDIFKDLLNTWEGELHIIQLDNIPPNYFNFETMKEKALYQELDKLNWRFVCNFRPEKQIDYGYIISPSKDLIQKAISLTEEG